MAVAIPGPWVFGGELVWLLDFRLWGLLAIVAIASVAAWISFWPERKFRKELSQREPIDDATFFREFYSASGIPEDIPRRLKPLFCEFFQIEPGKLRPADRPPEIVELDTVDLIRDIEKEFVLSISDKDAEQINGSFDSIVQYVVKHRAFLASPKSAATEPIES